MIQHHRSPNSTNTHQNDSLPPGWTQHTAPTGHQYYYNAQSQTSTYTRPTASPPTNPFPQSADYIPLDLPPTLPPFTFTPLHDRTPAQPRISNFDNRPRRRGPPPDRPKSKHAIPECPSWFLIKTRLGRRFVHNAENGESFWQTPESVIEGVRRLDEEERTRRESGQPNRPVQRGEEREGRVDKPTSVHEEKGGEGGEESSDYDEIIVEEVSDEEDAHDSGSRKRPRLSASGDEDEGEEDVPTQPMELTEEDLAYQLAALSEPDEDDDPDIDNLSDNGPLHDADAADAEAEHHFAALLSSHNINPYTTWDNLIASPQGESLISDDRYTLLPNMRSRRAAFEEWSSTTIEKQRADKERQAQQDPRVSYLRFLDKHATPKLYWAEFRKKYRKEAALTDRKLSDKDREKLYREHVHRITKLDESERKDDVWRMLKKMPVGSEWNRDIDPSEGSLPDILLADVRWISIKLSSRERLVRDFITRLPHADETDDGDEHGGTKAGDRDERKRREALQQRQRQVEEAKSKQQRDARHGKEQLLQEEAELRRAMKVGHAGLKGQLGP